MKLVINLKYHDLPKLHEKKNYGKSNSSVYWVQKRLRELYEAYVDLTM